MAGQTVCVRGIIRVIDITHPQKSQLVKWNFSDNRTGYFAISSYLGWHPITGKSMALGDCVAITGVIQVTSDGRPYIYWGANSTFKFREDSKGITRYYEHPDLQVIEGNSSFCQ